jgi:hypothetical protein
LFLYVIDRKVGAFGVPEEEAVKIFEKAHVEFPGKGSEPDRQEVVDKKEHYIAAQTTPAQSKANEMPSFDPSQTPNSTSQTEKSNATRKGIGWYEYASISMLLLGAFAMTVWICRIATKKH